MNPKFLSYYSKELRFLKEMGQEFAQQYPKVASRLALHTTDIPDPYIERLLEGVAFLTARTQLKLDAEYPRFVQRILEVVYPDFLTQKPAAAIANFEPDTHYHTDILHKLHRGQILRSLPIDEYKVNCPFSVCQTMEITPLNLEKAQYTDALSYLPNHLLSSTTAKVQSTLRLDFSLCVPGACSDMIPEQLRLYLGGELSKSSSLLYLLLSSCTSVVCHASDNPKSWAFKLPETPVHLGFSDEEALQFDLSKTVAAFRIFQEYATLPEKFLFIGQNGLKQALQDAENADCISKLPQQTEEIINEKGVNKKIITYQKRYFSLSFLFHRTLPELNGLVHTEDFLLNAVPVVNLFKQKGVRFPINIQDREHHVLIDRTQPLNYEVHSIEKVTGFDQHNRPVATFSPIYQSPDKGLFPNTEHLLTYFSARREDRVPSTETKQRGFRSSYLGSEVFLSLADAQNNIFNTDIQHLAVEAWCSSRDLPLLMPRDGVTDFLLEGTLPIRSIKLASKLTRPKEAPNEDDSAWGFLNQLSLNYTSLLDNTKKSAVLQLRGLLSVFINKDDKFLKKQIEAIIRVHSEPAQRIIRHHGVAALIRGVSLTIVLDETLLGGVHPFLFGSILNQYFCRLVSLNSFVQINIETVQQGHIAQWHAEGGTRKLL